MFCVYQVLYQTDGGNSISALRFNLKDLHILRFLNVKENARAKISTPATNPANLKPTVRGARHNVAPYMGMRPHSSFFFTIYGFLFLKNFKIIDFSDSTVRFAKNGIRGFLGFNVAFPSIAHRPARIGHLSGHSKLDYNQGTENRPAVLSS